MPIFTSTTVSLNVKLYAPRIEFLLWPGSLLPHSLELALMLLVSSSSSFSVSGFIWNMGATEDEIAKIGRKLEKIIHRKDSSVCLQSLLKWEWRAVILTFAAFLHAEFRTGPWPFASSSDIAHLTGSHSAYTHRLNSKQFEKVYFWWRGVLVVKVTDQELEKVTWAKRHQNIGRRKWWQRKERQSCNGYVRSKSR